LAVRDAWGNQVLKPGTSVSSNRTTSCAPSIGISWRVSLPIVTPETMVVTNSSAPTGGVIMPSVRLTITTMANCSGSIPSDSAIGASTGTKIITPGSGSMKMPASSRKRLISSSSSIGPSPSPEIQAAAVCGTWPTVRIHPKTSDVAITIRIDDVSRAVRSRIEGSIDIESVPYTNRPTMSA